MAANPNDPHDPEGFDPYRRRREIEQMEQKFRERADRHGGGPVSTGEIDQRVSNEMEQFFSESTERAARVVPQLDDRPGEGMHETTGEIRRKIDDFFSQVKDAGGGAATPNTQEIQARRPRWQGFFPGQDAAAPSGGSVPAPAQASAPPPQRSSDDPPRPTLSRGLPPQATPSSAVQPSARGFAPPAQSFGSSGGGRGPSSVGGGASDDDRPKMDLKTALEKLRRHGGSSSGSDASVPGAASAANPAMSQGAAGSFAPRPAAASVAPQRPEVNRPDVRPAAASLSGQRTSAPASSQPNFVPPKREPTVGNLPPIRSDTPRTGPATTSVPVVPPRAEPSVRGGQPPRADGRTYAQNATPQAMPPRREPSTGSIPELRASTASPVTPPAVAQAPAALGKGPVRRDAPVALGSSSGPASAPLSAAMQSAQPSAAPVARRPAEPIAAQRPQAAPPTPARLSSSSASRSQPAFEDEIDASGTGAGVGDGASSADRGPRSSRPASAAAAMRAASVAAAVARPAARPTGPAPLDRQLPRVPAASTKPAADPDRPPESPIRVLRHRSVVDLDVSSATGDDAESSAPRGPSAAAQMYRQSFGAGGAGAPSVDRAPGRPVVRPTAPSAPRVPPTSPRVDPRPQPRADRDGAAPVASDSGLAFDQIFDELQGLVLDTLRTSVDESFDAARDSEQELAAAAGLPQAAPLSQPISEDVPQVVARQERRTERAGERAGERAVERAGERQVSRQPSAQAQPVAPRATDASKFDRVSDEDEPEGDADVAPSAPYDWGVRKSQRPQGAWLIEGEEQGIESPRRRPVVDAPTPVARAAQAPVMPQSRAPANAAGPGDSAGGSVGGRSYLVRKLGEEVTRFQPALDALRAKGLVSENDLADPDAPRAKAASKSGGSDDMLSVDHFAERKPADLERELSPTKLVEDLRRLRRLTEALIAKGLLTEQDLQRAAEDE